MATSLHPSIDPVLQPLWIAADRAGIWAAGVAASLAQYQAAVAALAAQSTAATAVHTAAKQALASAVTANDPTIDLTQLRVAADHAGIWAAGVAASLAQYQAAVAALAAQSTAATAVHTAAKQALANASTSS